MPLKAGNHLGPGLLIGPHHLAQFFRVELAGEHSRVHQVTKQHSELTPFGFRGLWCEGWDGNLASTESQRDGLFHGLRRGRSWWRYSAGLTNPDQASAFFINDLRVPKEEGFLDVFQVGLIQGKLPHHGPIRDSPATLEHREHLIKNLLKGHTCSLARFLCLHHDATVLHAYVL